MDNPRVSLKKATLLTAIPKYFNVIVSLAVSTVLARLLTPDDYGVVAVVAVFITFFDLFADLGFGSAYIQRKDATKDDRNVLFSFMCYVASCLYFLFFCFGFVIAWFYRNSVYIHLSWVLGVSIFFTAVGAIPSSSLLKDQKFAVVGFVTLISSIVSAGAAILFAFFKFSYWSIVFQSVINSFISCSLYICFARPKFSFHVKWNVIKKYSAFSLGQLGFNAINYFSRNLDNILIGRMFNEEQLGFYDKAYKTSTYPVTYFSSVIGYSALPVLATKQDDKEYIYQNFTTLFNFLLIIGFFVSLSLYFSSREIILILYGEQWTASIIPFSFLALSLWAQMPLNITGAFFQILGKTKLLFVIGCVSAGILISGITVGVWLGSIDKVSIGYLVSATVNFLFCTYFIQKHLFGRKPWELFRSFLKNLLVFALCFGLCFLVFHFNSFDNVILSFLFKESVVFGLYFILIFLFRQDVYLRRVLLRSHAKTSRSER